MSTRKRLLLALLALAVLGLLLFSFRAQPVPVTVATVGRGPLQETVEQEGRTRIRERYVLSAPVAAVVPRLPFEVGDAVKAGQLLAALAPAPSALLDARARAEAEARVSQAEAQLESAVARVASAEAGDKLAREQLRRAKDLFARKQISHDAFDQAQAQASEAAAELRAARFAADAARGELAADRAVVRYSAARQEGQPVESLRLTSPVSGQVLAIEEKSEHLANAGTPILTLGDPHLLEVAVDVLSADAVRIRPGMRVLFQRWGGEGDLEGRVRTVEPTAFTKVSALGVEEQRVWVIADFTSPPALWQNLGDRYRVEARFILWEGKDVLQVPASALFRDGDDWALFTAEGGHARKRRVQVGHRGDLEAEVLGGVTEGERVITHPPDTVADGVRIEVQGD